MHTIWAFVVVSIGFLLIGLVSKTVKVRALAIVFAFMSALAAYIFSPR